MTMRVNSNNLKSQIMELKTSTPGVTRKEEIKTGFKNVNDYSKYLQEKYNYMNTGTTSMHGVPVNVSVSSSFLKKCMDNPEKAAFLEENLVVLPKCVESSVNHTKGLPGSPTMTYCDISVDESGNISMTSGCTNDPDGKIARENAKRKIEERKLSEKRAKEKLKEKEKIERLKKQKNNKKADDFTFTVSGQNVEDVTLKLMDISLGASKLKAGLTGIDVIM